jgi:hypothetical protein
MLVPMTRQRLTGGMLLAVGIVELVLTARHVIASRGKKGETPLPRKLRVRLLLPAAAAVFVCMSGLDLIDGRADLGFYMLAAVLWLIVTASRNAWELLVLVGQVRDQEPARK